MIRHIEASDITSLVERLCIEANCVISKDIEQCFLRAKQTEKSPLGREIIGTLLRNAEIARSTMAPICQDTGMTVVFVEMGQNIHINGGFIEDAINEGVRQGYQKGYLRKSVVRDALLRENTGDNTPAIIHYEIVPGDVFRITVSPKGFGSENKSDLQMLTPAQGIPGIKKVVLDTVSHAGANPCPPIIVGVGIGGTMEKAALMAKKALLRPVGQHSEREDIAKLEEELLDEINKLGIGPAGFGGSTTAMAVNIITGPTHIAGLPVAVNIGCHVTRHAEGSI
ncbi:fumarate hydratase class I, aerobic; L(+)-tartrate dehydratase alpha subunit [Porphyromonas crevioricanis JCM 15906]|uniref:Fumarate hydratase class I, aerobic L(+)-tartrate dehydratase alpha subunit n=1 Tax=Porphyromonas crevioricanis JCM 15906 TaxID=1305617 RepID=T1DRZ1_9PORP|nr:fumarate hydratase class I, aerobic; L(+)-tartrate dehydratase alpha subunit [Porphyromonas crevioricanis JCM 15906]SJZ97381.1 fumarate hydratase subunit alpha [Porphyromonas crevioricanis]